METVATHENSLTVEMTDRMMHNVSRMKQHEDDSGEVKTSLSHTSLDVQELAHKVDEAMPMIFF